MLDGVYQVLRPLVVRSFVAVESAVWNVVKEVLGKLVDRHQVI